MSLPSSIVLKSYDRDSYLGFRHDKGTYNGYVEFTETRTVSPYAKFVVELANKGGEDGLVHIRSPMTNKYWVRTQNLSITGRAVEQYWITATADKPEEDRSKESCTLFQPISVDEVAKTFRIKHVQSGCYLCLWPLDKPEFPRGVLSNYKVLDGHHHDIFTVIDWDSLVVLPKYLAFKGNNDLYLSLRQIEGYPYLQFASDDIGDSTVSMELYYLNDGTLRIKPTSSNKFWRRSPNWIWADSGDTSGNDKDTLFRPFKVNDKTIALQNLGNNYFCKRLTTEGKTSCLNAAVPTITKEAYLRVEEPVLKRQIYNIRYDFEGSRVYDEKVLVVAKNSATNHSTQSNTLDVKLSYTENSTSTWSSNSSLRFEAKATFEIGIPKIAEGNVELSNQFETNVEWGETKTTTTVVEVVHKVTVPPLTKVTVYLIAKNGKCDVPFVYSQKDTLYNGTTVTADIKGNTYTGSNYYSVEYETKEERLSS